MLLTAAVTFQKRLYHHMSLRHNRPRSSYLLLTCQFDIKLGFYFTDHKEPDERPCCLLVKTTSQYLPCVGWKQLHVFVQCRLFGASVCRIGTYTHI